MDQYLEFISNHPLLFLALAAVIAMLIWTELRRFTVGYQIITPNDAVRLMNQGDALILDVREDNEVRQGFIEGAKHIPLGVLAKRIDEISGSKGKPVIAYCRSGNRSASACSILTKAGFENVHNLKGGVMAWSQANLPLKKKK
ncbi:MAG TPA: rhodanese-like domain-containing protein [Thioalkalivibrio sp.]|nr:rhodanese-like domain-containing protein [Thioalkalivibrio sp.]